MLLLQNKKKILHRLYRRTFKKLEKLKKSLQKKVEKNRINAGLCEYNSWKYKSKARKLIKEIDDITGAITGLNRVFDKEATNERS